MNKVFEFTSYIVILFAFITILFLIYLVSDAFWNVISIVSNL